MRSVVKWMLMTAVLSGCAVRLRRRAVIARAPAG